MEREIEKREKELGDSNERKCEREREKERK